ncbi:MAG TPA: GDP-mannose 4,6-dehydratase [Planctomycetota bacterium]|nr:GDP-mannose 4,6-dehydratase [Planctomycetota bacterium]
MKMLITGGAGFIGVHSAHRFAGQHDVTVLDDLSRKGSAANLEWLRASRKVAFEQIDVRNAEAARACVRKMKPEAVLHFAAQVAVTTSVTDPRTDFEINALGTLNMLEAVRLEAPRAAFIYSSTNKVYGELPEFGTELVNGRYQYSTHEDGVTETQGLDFHSPYGCSKGAADQYVRDYARIYGLRSVVFRQSCIYGTRQFGVEDQGWIAWFAIRSVLNKPVTIYGDGRQVRDVLWVEDLVDAYELALQKIERVQGRIFNMGGGPERQFSLLELVELLNELNGRKLEYSFADWRPGDQKVFVANVSAAARELGWSAKVSPREGVAKIVEWVTANRQLFEA